MKKKKPKKFTKFQTSNLGFISSLGGDGRNADYFNIFTKSALFDYNNAKKIYEYCLLVDKNFTKYLGKKRPKHIPEYIDGDYNLKKRKILTQDWYMDDIGNSISIKKIKVPKLGEGIAYAPSFELFGGDAWWLKSSFLKNYIKFKKGFWDYIDVDDNTLCFGFFDMQYDIWFNQNENLDFFKSKNKTNIDKFNKFINDKYKSILNKDNMGGHNIIECKVRNGKHVCYNMILTRSIPNSIVSKGEALGSIYICKSK